MVHGAEAARRAGGAPVPPGANRLALGSDAGDHSRPSAATVLDEAGKLPAHEDPYHLCRAVACLVLDPVACPSLDQADPLSPARVVHPSPSPSLAQVAHPYQDQVASPFQAQAAYADQAGTEGHQGASHAQDHTRQEASPDARPSAA